METFQKQPWEAYPISFDFVGKLPTGASIDTGTVSAMNTSTLVDATADVLNSSTATVSGTEIQAFVKAGVHGYDYKITFKALLTPGSPVLQLEEDVTMEVREL